MASVFRSGLLTLAHTGSIIIRLPRDSSGKKGKESIRVGSGIQFHSPLLLPLETLIIKELPQKLPFRTRRPLYFAENTITITRSDALYIRICSAKSSLVVERSFWEMWVELDKLFFEKIIQITPRHIEDFM